MNIKQLAKQLGLSISTVSRALNAKDDVSTATQERVRAAARRFGYAPNVSGRNLRKGKISTVIFMLPTGHADNYFTSPFFIRTAASLQQELQQHDIDLVIHICRDQEDEMKWLKKITSQQTSDAVIITNTKVKDARIHYLVARQFPFAALGRSESHSSRVNWVDFNFYKISCEITEQFIRDGHRRIALCSLGHDCMQGKLFTAGYTATLQRHHIDIDPQIIHYGDISETTGYNATEKFLHMAHPPDALIFLSDLQAVGSYFYRKQNPTPAPLPAIFSGIIGCDISLMTEPMLCGTMPPVETIGHALTTTILHALHQRQQPPQQIEYDLQISANLRHTL